MKKTVFSFACFVFSLISFQVSFASNFNLVPRPELRLAADDLNPALQDVNFIDARQTADKKIFGCTPIDWKIFYKNEELLPKEKILSLLKAKNIDVSKPFIVLDNGLDSGNAAKLAWILNSAGIGQIKILFENAETVSPKNNVGKLSFGLPVATSAPTIKDLVASYSDKNLVIIDARTDEEFIGWTLNGEKRGGHIREAVNISPDWFIQKNSLIDADQILSVLYAKSITPEKKIVIYSGFDTNAAKLYFLLKYLGYQDVSCAAFSYRNWAENPLLPISFAPNFQALVSPQWVYGLIRNQEAPTLQNKKFAVYEVSWGPLEKAKKYAQGHIPGSFHLNSDTFEDENHYWDLFTPEKLFANLAENGIDKDTTIVLYGIGTDTISATIAFWALKVAGVEDVRLMNGNFERWLSLGYPSETKINKPEPRGSFGRTDYGHPEFLTSTEKAKEIIDSPNGRLASVRSWDEHTGKIVTHSYIKAKGEPKGAYWAKAGYGENKSDLSNYFDLDGSYRSYTEIAEMWGKQDIYPHNEVAFYCGTGARGSTGWFFSYLMGWPNASLYDSGWFGWTEGKPDPTNPSQNIWNSVQ